MSPNHPTLYLLMGLPGAGKTTTAKILSTHYDATRLSSDEVRLSLFSVPTFSRQEHKQLYKYLNQRTRQLLQAGQNVIYDANLNHFVHRQEKYQLAKDVGATPMLLWVQTPKKIAKQRRLHAVNQQLIPPDESSASMFERIAHTIESPGPSEPYITIDGELITPGRVMEQLGRLS